MPSKKVVIGIPILLLALAGGLGTWWYVSVPHTPEAALALAVKAEETARANSATKKSEELKPDIDQAITRLRAVGRFGKSPQHAEALDRIAKIQRDLLKDDAAALAALDELAKAYPQEEVLGGGALITQGQIVRKQAEALKAEKKIAEATARFKEALEKFEDYRNAFPAGKRVDETLLETARIWHKGIGEPLIKAIEPYEHLVRDYPASEFKPEAMYQLGQLYEMAGEYEKALQMYARLGEEFPKSKWAEDALWARGNLLKDKMDRAEEAAKELEKLAREHPDSPLAGQAKSAAEEARGKAAVKEADAGAKARYGGSVPVDTTIDKPVPPWEELKRFAAQKLDAQKYDLNVELTPADHRITVTGTLTLINKGDAKNDTLLFMLNNGLAVQRVTVNGDQVKHVHEGDTLQLALGKPIAAGAAVTLGFEYSGQFAGPMNEADEEDGEEKIIETKTGPKKFKAVNGAATKAAHASHFNMNPQLTIGKSGYALSGGAWYPITVLGDLFDAKTTFHVPAALEAVATGAVEKRAPGAGGKGGEFVFTTARPVFGLYFAYGDYKVDERTVGAVKYFTYLRAANAEKSAAYVEVASRILNFYSDKYAPFPYEKMAIVETPLPEFLGGVGPSSMMFLSEKMVAQKDPPEFLLAHELAHQWFGNLIPINIADPGYSQWVSEGFATYCDALYTEKREGKEKFVNQMRRYAQTYFDLSMRFSRDKSTVRNCLQSSPLYRPIVYEKGALVLHALRKLMGDDKFFSAMRQYVSTCQDKQTTVADFEKIASAVSGQDLAWFFKQWLDEPSFAHWIIKDVITPETAAPGTAANKITMQVEQPHDLIKAAIDITLISTKGERHVVKDVMLDKKEQTVEMAAPFIPAKIILDEDNWILHHPGSANVWPGAKKEVSATTGKAMASAATQPAPLPEKTPTTQPVETAPALK